MGNMPRTAPTGSDSLSVRPRFTGIIDENGEPTVGGGDGDLCRVIVDEHDDEVYVRVLTHRGDGHKRRTRAHRECLDCPVRVSLPRTLGERPVIDMDTAEELLLYTPRYLNNVLQPDHGYHQVVRRRRTPDVDARASGRSPEAR
jgi:hypothetical protein